MPRRPVLIAAALGLILGIAGLSACQQMGVEARARQDADTILDGMRKAYDPGRWPTAARPP